MFNGTTFYSYMSAV